MERSNHRPENLPVLEVRAVVVRHKDGSTTLRIQVLMGNGFYVTEKQYHFVSGAPTPDDVVDSSAALSDLLQEVLVATLGIQGVMLS